MELLHNAIEGVENARYNFRHALKRKFETSNQRVSIFFFSLRAFIVCASLCCRSYALIVHNFGHVF